MAEVACFDKLTARIYSLLINAPTSEPCPRYIAVTHAGSDVNQSRAFVRWASYARVLTGSWSRQRGNSLFEMTPCESPARARLQVPFKANSRRLIRKFHDDVKLPGSARGRVWTMAGVVICQPGLHIRGEPDKEM
jgi:hypothetical protein